MRKKAEEKNKVDIEINDKKPTGTDSQSEDNDIKEPTDKNETTNKETAPEEKSDEQIIAEYKEKVQELEDRYLRLAAEFENYKKRTSRQFEGIIKNSNEKIITSILEVVDNFERALEVASKSVDFKAFREGTELVYQHLSEILKKEGVETIDAVGEKFDPNLHEAMMQVESDEYPEGVVIQEISRGYKLNGKVVRFSKVAVSGQKQNTEGKENGSDKE
jgi:molecular chaperone GrpE